MNLIYYFTFQDKTAFFPLKYVYPECMVHIKDNPKIYPLSCFIHNQCPVNANCSEILAKRVHYLFDKIVPQSEIIIAYYKYPDRPQSIRGAVFSRDLDPPTVSILNPYAFRKFQREGVAYKWVPTSEYSFMSGSKQLITLDSNVEV